jgi:hypothetical protein
VVTAWVRRLPAQVFALSMQTGEDVGLAPARVRCVDAFFDAVSKDGGSGSLLASQADGPCFGMISRRCARQRRSSPERRTTSRNSTPLMAAPGLPLPVTPLGHERVIFHNEFFQVLPRLF